MVSGKIIVVDVGKTLSKVSLWTRAGEMLDRQVRPNALIESDDFRRLDAGGIGEWIVETLARYAGEGVDMIVPVGHGAGVAVVVDGRLAAAPLDYEQELPAALLQAYRHKRDPFATTGSPALPAGLNLGAQIYWLEQTMPLADATLIPWAQYWTWFLSGRAVSEVSSLGCHTDLWSPSARAFSPFAKGAGWADRFAPILPASDIAGTLRADLAARTGLATDVKILTGLHDSNAALHAARGFEEIAGHDATILSTGTWFIAMRLGAGVDPVGDLPEDRDCLVNVDIHGNPVPSARFMGGREIETIIGFDTRQVDIRPDQPALVDAVPALLENGAMLLPTLAPGCGPFGNAQPHWRSKPAEGFGLRAAACLYAALVADEALGLVGARSRLLVEGRFADAEVFVRALAALRPETAVYTANAHNDVSFGALRLVEPGLRPAGCLAAAKPLDGDLAGYRSAWKSAMAEADGRAGVR